MKMERKAENHILIVSHSLGTLELFKHLISQHGYKLYTATDGRAACEIAQQERPDIVISEALMPGLSGMEVCRFIRQHPDIDKTPVLLISVEHSESQIVEDVLRAGANDYLEAPFSPLLLQTKVAQLLEQKFVEEMLCEQEDLYRATFNLAPVGILHTDEDGRCLQVNQQLSDLLGYSSEDLISKSLEEIIYWEDVEVDNLARHDVLTNAYPDFGREIRLIRKDKGICWVYSVIRLLRGRFGEPKYFITAFEDITRRKKLEQQLLHSQRREAIGHLASGIVHSFNNLLTAIIGYSELTIKRLPGESSIRRNLEEIKRTADQAALLTRRLLTFSRKQVVQSKVFDLSALVSGMEILLQRLVGEDIELWTLFEANIGRIKADPGQFEQVVLNLVMNARDAMPDGGKLLIEIEKKFLDKDQAIQQGLALTGHYVLLTVTDNGSGMDEVTQKQIFEPFFTTKATDKGTGLGLSTVYGIVEQAGGTISVDSEVGQGTTFKVFLPGVDEDISEERNQSRIEESIYGTETILLAEDDSMVRKVVHTTLESYGYQVLAAANGGEAILLARQYQDTIHLLLTDVVMPEMNGQKLENRLRQMFPKMKTLFISGYSDEILSHHGLINPEKPHLQKPFTPVALGRRVREVLDT